MAKKGYDRLLFRRCPIADRGIKLELLTEGCIWGKVNFYSPGRLFCQDDPQHRLFLSGKSANPATKQDVYYKVISGLLE